MAFVAMTMVLIFQNFLTCLFANTVTPQFELANAGGLELDPAAALKERCKKSSAMKILVWLVGVVLAGALLFTEPYAAQNAVGKISEDRIPVVQAGLTGSPGVFTGLSASQARVLSKTRPKSTRVGGNPCPTIVIRSATSEAIFLRRVQQCGFGREAH